jgi:hypothetical protein
LFQRTVAAALVAAAVLAGAPVCAQTQAQIQAQPNYPADGGKDARPLPPSILANIVAQTVSQVCAPEGDARAAAQRAQGLDWPAFHDVQPAKDDKEFMDFVATDRTLGDDRLSLSMLDSRMGERGDRKVTWFQCNLMTRVARHDDMMVGATQALGAPSPVVHSAMGPKQGWAFRVKDGQRAKVDIGPVEIPKDAAAWARANLAPGERLVVVSALKLNDQVTLISYSRYGLAE